jgi:hypothetical protein
VYATRARRTASVVPDDLDPNTELDLICQARMTVTYNAKWSTYGFIRDAEVSSEFASSGQGFSIAVPFRPDRTLLISRAVALSQEGHLHSI